MQRKQWIAKSECIFVSAIALTRVKPYLTNMHVGKYCCMMARHNPDLIVGKC